jgi:hypothetical protein
MRVLADWISKHERGFLAVAQRLGFPINSSKRRVHYHANIEAYNAAVVISRDEPRSTARTMRTSAGSVCGNGK